LDNYTFDKMVSVPGVKVLVQFDEEYSSPEVALREIGRLSVNVPNFIVGSVSVGSFGDMQNDDLRERFGLSTDEFPVYLLFDGFDKKIRYEGFPLPGSRKPANWDEEEDGTWEPSVVTAVTADNLITWLRINGVKLPSLSTIQELDEVVEKFMTEGRNPSYLSVASSLAEEYKVDAKAAMYTRIMQKVVDKGVGYVNTEIQRVHKLLSGPVVETKREELESKIKVLNVFSQSEEL